MSTDAKLQAAQQRLSEARASLRDAEACVSRERARVNRERLEEHQRTKNAHKKQLAIAAGLVGHPKLDALYDLAWEHGHSAGWNEVETYFKDFARLL